MLVRNPACVSLPTAFCFPLRFCKWWESSAPLITTQDCLDAEVGREVQTNKSINEKARLHGKSGSHSLQSPPVCF